MIPDQDEGEDVKKENEKRNDRFVIHDNDILHETPGQNESENILHK